MAVAFGSARPPGRVHELITHPVDLSAQPPAGMVLFRGGPLGNFASSPITLACPHTGDPLSYPTVEHYFQASKARTLDEHLLVASQPSAKLAKRAGRRIALRPDWETVKTDVMLTALRAKFSQPFFAAALLTTEDGVIAENSPTDFEWGVRDATGGFAGQNRLGRLLMQVRAELRKSTSTTDQLSLEV
jgi:ribA/ribD-fused uncharacterized protein